MKKYFIYCGIAIALYVLLSVLHKLFHYDIMSFIFLYCLVTSFDHGGRLYDLEHKGK